MPAPSYETLKKQKAELEAQLAEAKSDLKHFRMATEETIGDLQGEIGDLKSDLDYLSSQAASADRLQFQLRRCVSFLDNLKMSFEFGFTTLRRIQEFEDETLAVLENRENDATPAN